MYGVSLTYGTQTNNNVRLSRFLSEVVQAGGQDVNPSGMQALLANALLATEACLIYSGSAITTSKIFYYVNS